MTPSRSKKIALLNAQYLFDRCWLQSRFWRGRLIKALAERLSSSVILGRADINEHAMLLERVHALFEHPRKHVLLKARGSLRHLIEHGAVEYIHATIYYARSGRPGFFAKAHDAMIGVHMNGSISSRIRNFAHRYTDQATVLSMKLNELAQIKFQK